MKKDVVDWNEQPLKRWIGSITKKTTLKAYKSAFRKYLAFTGKTPKELLDEALKDKSRSPVEKEDFVKQSLIAFYEWLRNECPKKQGGTLGSKTIGKGLSSKASHMYVNGIRSFYATYDVYVKLKGRSRLEKAEVENERRVLSNMEVKRLIRYTTSPRDRAMILTMFQSGTDVSTLCNIKYKDVAKGLQEDEYPLKLNLRRQKTGNKYYSFLGRDAKEALHAYLADVKSKGITLKPKSPLFIKLWVPKTPEERMEGGKRLRPIVGMTPNLIQKMMKDVAIKSGFIDKENNGNFFNPVGPHALRESFSSILGNKGVATHIIDFLIGHEVGEMKEAYFKTDEEDLRQIYLEIEPHISISQQTIDVEEVKRKVRAEMDDTREQLQTMVNGLTIKNLELEDRVKETEKRFKQMEEQFNRLDSFWKKQMKHWEKQMEYIMPPEDTHESGKVVMTAEEFDELPKGKSNEGEMTKEEFEEWKERKKRKQLER